MRAELRALGLGFVYQGADHPAFEGIDLAVAAGRTAVVLGPSGCGKSTLLRVLAGLLPTTAGAVSRPSATAGSVSTSLVFQDPRLLPWMTVRENLHFALECAGVPPGQRDGRILPLLERVGLVGVLDRRPVALSGGMAQRVGLVRALSLAPRCLLLDEPFGAVDPLLRERLQVDLQTLLVETDAAAVLVTHDVAEALVLGDEIVVLSAGPGRVVDRIAVEAPRPRGVAFRFESQFVSLERRVRAALGGAADPPPP